MGAVNTLGSGVTLPSILRAATMSAPDALQWLNAHKQGLNHDHDNQDDSQGQV